MNIVGVLQSKATEQNHCSKKTIRDLVRLCCKEPHCGLLTCPQFINSGHHKYHLGKATLRHEPSVKRERDEDKRKLHALLRE